MQTDKLNGLWETRDKTISITFNGNQYDYYENGTHYTGAFTTTEIEKGKIIIFEFYYLPDDVLWMIFDNDGIVAKKIDGTSYSFFKSPKK